MDLVPAHHRLAAGPALTGPGGRQPRASRNARRAPAARAGSWSIHQCPRPSSTATSAAGFLSGLTFMHRERGPHAHDVMDQVRPATDAQHHAKPGRPSPSSICSWVTAANGDADHVVHLNVLCHIPLPGYVLAICDEQFLPASLTAPPELRCRVCCRAARPWPTEARPRPWFQLLGRASGLDGPGHPHDDATPTTGSSAATRTPQVKFLHRRSRHPWAGNGRWRRRLPADSLRV